MLKIFLGSHRVKDEMPNIDFVEFPNAYFNMFKKAEWFKDELVREIIEEIDNAHVEMDFSVVNNDTGIGYSVDTLSGGAKFLILTLKDTDRVFFTTMGDNCTDLLEKIAKHHEDNGRDLLIVADYIHEFKFKYVDSIEYINYGAVCHSWDDIYKKAYMPWCDECDAEIASWDTDDEEDDDIDG